MKRRISYLAGVAAAATALTLGAFAAVRRHANPARAGTYDAFKVSSIPKSPVEFKAKAKSRMDLVVRRHDYAVGSTTGWHSHPGPSSSR